MILRSAVLSALLLSALLVSAPAKATDFGTPPPGQIPIFYDDHNVYAKPDILRKKRVLAAIVRNGAILVPLRSMFEAMGAVVSFDPPSRKFTVRKQGESIQLTIGKNVALINGAVRPLDQGPIVYRGVVLVPVRVISETMGAYVEWVPSRRIVVIRYFLATPAPVPTPTPTPAPPPPPAPRLVPYHGFVAVGFSAGKNYNEFSAGQYCRADSYVASGALLLGSSRFALKADFRQDAYVTSDVLRDRFGNHFTRFATIDGGFAITPVFLATQSTLDARLEYRVADPLLHVGISVLRTSDNYGYPHLSAVGGGLEKLPELRPGLSVFGSAYYYPDAAGDYTITNSRSSNRGKTYRQQYVILKYDAGVALVHVRYPVYLYAGWSGDRYSAQHNAPIDQTHGGPYAGLGVKF